MSIEEKHGEFSQLVFSLSPSNLSFRMRGWVGRDVHFVSSFSKKEHMVKQSERSQIRRYTGLRFLMGKHGKLNQVQERTDSVVETNRKPVVFEMPPRSNGIKSVEVKVAQNHRTMLVATFSYQKG